MGECRCGWRKYKWFRDFYWDDLYPFYIQPTLEVDEQEWVMRELNKK